jgi:hypothetical protein
MPPEATALLCHAHRLPLLPPHLEDFLGGNTSQLLSTKRIEPATSPFASTTSPTTTPSTPVGIRPDMDPATVNALMAAGISYQDILAQHMAMLSVETQQAPPPQAAASAPVSPRRSSLSENEVLDRENHVVVELVTEAEWKALQDTGCWPRSSVSSNFAVSVDVSARGTFSYPTLPCRNCDASGRSSQSDMSIKNRARGWCSPDKMTPRSPSLEY